jgi:hypothetical protein
MTTDECTFSIRANYGKLKSRPTVSGRSPDWLKMKNSACSTVKREAEEDWGKDRWRMTISRHIVALLQSHIAGDEDRFLSVATQLAAHEARQGHGKLAQELRELTDIARGKSATVGRRGVGPVPLAQPKGELSTFLSARYSDGSRAWC